MVDFRLYRVAFLPALAALVIAAFSLDGLPGALPRPLTPSVFQPREALSLAKQIATRAPAREPGSQGDAAVGDLVQRRFSQIPSALVSEQRYQDEWEGDDVELRNVIVRLPGTSDGTIAILAGRDADTQPAAASSAAATGALLALADTLAATDREKTLVLVSTDGSVDGASGAREFIDHYEHRDQIQSALVISQPGAREPRQPFLVTSSTGAERTSLQLTATAARELDQALGRQPSGEGAFTQIARLALPSGLGEQAALIAAGTDAVALSSAGERPLPAASDSIEALSGDTLAAIGRATLGTVLALDAAAAAPEHGPGSYVTLGGNLLPTGSLSLLALALLVPALVAAVDAMARASRWRLAPLRALRWCASLAGPPAAALLLLYLLALVGIVPRPAFPFDPRAFGVGVTEVMAMVLLAAVVVAGYALERSLRPPRGIAREALLAASGVGLCAGALLAWLANPMLGLLCVPLAHAWLPVARGGGRPAGVAGAAVCGAPLVAAVAVAASTIGAGVWDWLLVVADGQLGLFSCVAILVLAAAALALVSASGVDSISAETGSRVRPPEGNGAR